MLVKSANGWIVSFFSTNGKSIFDDLGREWVRDGQNDIPGYAGHLAQAAYSYLGGPPRYAVMDTIRLSKEQLQRVCRGSSAIATPVTVEELRYEADKFEPELRKWVETTGDDVLDRLLVTCPVGHKHALVDPVAALRDMAQAQVYKPAPVEKPEEAPPKPTEGHRERRTGRNTPRPRKQEGSLSVALGEVSVLLTPKQLEFMERLSECPGFDGSLGAEYSVSAYAVELEDTMNPMSVGAVVTTLREKGILTTRKCNVGGVKGSMFSLTDMGGTLYSKLAERGGGAQ